jgi:hypothetical protein
MQRNLQQIKRKSPMSMLQRMKKEILRDKNMRRISKFKRQKMPKRRLNVMSSLQILPLKSKQPRKRHKNNKISLIRPKRS